MLCNNACVYVPNSWVSRWGVWVRNWIRGMWEFAPVCELVCGRMWYVSVCVYIIIISPHLLRNWLVCESMCDVYHVFFWFWNAQSYIVWKTQQWVCQRSWHAYKSAFASLFTIAHHRDHDLTAAETVRCNIRGVRWHFWHNTRNKSELILLIFQINFKWVKGGGQSLTRVQPLCPIKWCFV